MIDRATLKLLFTLIFFILLFSSLSSLFFVFRPVKLDEVALDWQQVTTTIPWTRRDAAEVFLWPDETGKERLWFTGGITGDWDEENNRINYWTMPHWNDLWSSDNGSDWKLESEQLAWPPRRSLSIVSFRGQLWLLGGWSPIAGYQSDIWTSSDAKIWTKLVEKAPWPAREGQTITVWRDKLWLIGGVNFDDRKTFNDVWSSVDGLNWEVVATGPWSSRYDHAVQVFKNRLWLTGGLSLDRSVSGGGKSDIWSSVDGKNWVLIDENAPWGKRHGEELLVQNDRLWLISGWNTELDQGNNDVWTSLDGVFWQKTKDNPAWLGREDHSAIFFKDQLWLLGGMATGFKWQNDVWSTPLFQAGSGSQRSGQ